MVCTENEVMKIFLTSHFRPHLHILTVTAWAFARVKSRQEGCLMAGQTAAYAAALAILGVAGVLIFFLLRLHRSLRRWDRMAVRLVLKTDDALEEYVRLAREARETLESCRQSMEGFARLAEGARAVGDAAESAAQAAVNAAELLRERTASLFSEDAGDPSDAAVNWAGIGRQLGLYLRRKWLGYPEEPSVRSYPESNADA
jgi:hypothetical protein